ncbi:hypothetical protein EAX61_03810 [Dokdonia sinensis]|uniref:Tetratricopeptide repeat protein n=1 Tax=Dokdonia sinensis TaxID=2479847 RepID=A0A3M0GLF7_9FLAO|nr:hypothetical protein [Dokdonia sinensis]RMB63522.1 hypothetical protein EAX61_03810 [Dokdonia sinensis]
MRVLIAFLLLPICVVQAQMPEYTLPKQIDTLVVQGENCLKEKGENCSHYFDRALEEARKIDKDSLEALTYYSVGFAFYRYGNAQDFLENAKKAVALDGTRHPLTTHFFLEDLYLAHADLNHIDSLMAPARASLHWAEVAGSKSAMAAAYIRIAETQRDKGDVKGAIKTLLDARPIVKASGDLHRESGLLLTLGNTYNTNGDHPQALEKYEEAAQGFLKAEDSSMYILSISNWASIANRMGKTQEVLTRIQPLLDYYERNGGTKSIYLATQMAKAYVIDKDYDKAIPLLKENIEEAKAVGNEVFRLNNKQLLTELYIDMGEGALAVAEIKEIYDKVVSEHEQGRGSAARLHNVRKLYADAQTLVGNSGETGEIYQAYIRFNDSLFNETKEREIAAMRETFEADKREAQIALLKKGKEASRLQKWLLGAGLLALLAILGGLWVRFRESKKRAILERQKLNAEIAHKRKELTSQALNLAKKNETLIDLKEKITGMEKTTQSQDLLRTIEFDVREDKGWEAFMQSFQEVHKDFYKNIQQNYPDITAGELRLMSLLKMNLSSREIGNMLNISQEGVMKARYRLRKKLHLTKEDSLEQKILAL